MKFFNSMMQKVRGYVPLPDRILELVALLLLVGLLALTAILYQQAPEQIPTHFDWNHVPTRWTDKEMYWYMAFLFGVMMLLSASSAYNHKMVHLPVRLKAPVIGLQKRLISRMCRCTTLCVGMLWLSYLLTTSASFFEIPLLIYIVEKMSLLLLFAVLIFYSVRILWVGRRF